MEEGTTDRYIARSTTLIHGLIGRKTFFAVVGMVIFISCAFAQDREQKHFKSPEAAFSALVEAVKTNDSGALLSIFGPSGKDIISSGNSAVDKEAREYFVKAAGDAVKFSPLDDETMLVLIGKNESTYPVPLVKSSQGWVFFTEDGKEEIINRGVGRNELNAIQVALAYVDAQYEYASKDRDGDGVLQYARKFVSHAGKKDGLYWEAVPGEEASPMGPLFARATEEGYLFKKKGEKPAPYHGYYFKILKGQGSNAPGGERDYIINGRMVAGFGLVAYPAEYGVSGIMTLIVNQEGTVYEKDLGPKTGKIAKAMKNYDPDKTWKKEEWTPDALRNTVVNPKASASP
jgi:Protein of unknown function (DUF2950)